jgi:hypothetical protein
MTDAFNIFSYSLSESVDSTDLAKDREFSGSIKVGVFVA